ncbi:unnamed protein product [Rangifer tarandus platyrhynchus]|uniref:Uncharacterized protein n=1 Tax=Rangifer tarandus platyrhynchus TaxID=3082113 RepID=A0AC59Y7G6_RANTA
MLMSDVSQSRGSWRRLGGSLLQSDCQKPVPTAGPRSGAEKQAHLPLGESSQSDGKQSLVLIAAQPGPSSAGRRLVL